MQTKNSEDKLKAIIRGKVKQMLMEYQGDNPAMILGYIKDEVEKIINIENEKRTIKGN